MKLRCKDSGSRRVHSKYPERITSAPSLHMLTKVADFKGSYWNAFITQSETVITSFLRISDGSLDISRLFMLKIQLNSFHLETQFTDISMKFNSEEKRPDNFAKG
ncbi:MAG: hypothetical protein EZS28_023980 [Streblomastix strix]|uniref:Uncharacterized protein n=1 Tax=Streblomastix strix TaxID=222440 RepID=A0A5J4VDC8_9EUKA|nr:MAG: hypothetical protein EZS28_023980 [Streblomastix strix]